MNRIIIAITLILLTNFSFANINYTITKIADKLGIVWGFDFIDSQHIIFTKKFGTIGILNIANNQITHIPLPFNNLYTEGQGGLLDIQIHNDYIYLTASRRYNETINTVLSRFKLSNNTIVNFVDLFIANTKEDSSRHFGSRIAFDDNFIYFSVGDRANRDSAQQLAVDNGSIIRLNFDGSIPQTNPYNNGIYSYGHRNPQGLFFDTKTKRLLSNEHGPRGGDEINIITKGKNYGWPIISYGKEYWGPISVGEGTHKRGMQQPIHQFTPSIAPSDLIVYRSNDKALDGIIISSALKLQHLNLIKLDNHDAVISEQRIYLNPKQRVRSIKQYKKSIYATTDNGNLYQIDLTAN